LVYDGGTERTATLWTSFGVMLGVLAMGLYKWRLASYPPFARN